MNIEKIAAKLKPLMPDEVTHWMRNRELADPDLKTLIEKQIISTAYKHLGDFHDKILLSLPPEKRAKGSINLGTVIYDKEKWDFGISRKELMQNLAIFGRSGAGKTNVAFHILEQLDNIKIPYLFFDNKRTLRHLIPKLKNKVNIYTPGRTLSKFSFNPFITPPGLENSVYINQLIDVMARAFTLGDGSKSILQKAIFACYERGNNCPSVKDVIREVNNIQSKERIHGWKISALRALESLSFSDIATDITSQEELTKKLIGGNTVIELDGLSDGMRRFLIPIIYQWIFQVKLSSQEREELGIAVFVDEAHLIFGQQSGSSNQTLMERLLRQTRELGIATIIMDQTPSLISKVVLANCYTNIFLNLASVACINKASGVSLVNSEDKHYFSMLSIGQGIVKLQDRWHRPFLVKFPLVDIKKGQVTDKLLADFETKKCNWWEVINYKFSDIALGNKHLRFIENVLLSKDIGVEQRYKLLNINNREGNQIKNELVKSGWLNCEKVNHGQTRKLLLCLTPKAKTALGIDNDMPRYGSLVHEYWKRFYARKFEKLGFKIWMEFTRKSGRMDIAAFNYNGSVAIEIETGKSDAVRNVKQDLSAGFGKVLVVATDRKVMDKVVVQLAKAGLLIRGKVEVVMEDDFRCLSDMMRN